MAGIAIAMPRLGMTMEEGRVVDWPVPLGERIAKGATVLVIETEKAESEVEATADGFMRHVYVPAGETAPCGALLGASSESADEPFDPEAFAAAYHGPSDEPAKAAAAEHPSARAPARRAAAARGERRPVAPAARALAKKLGIGLEGLTGSGPGGRVTRQDVEARAAAREGLVPVERGVALEVLREGRGDPVVLLPGFGSDVSSFALQTPALREGHCVIGVNPRGVGLSDAPEQDAYEVARAAEDVAALLDAPAHVVGASLGAAAALELALSHPERVRSLTLVTPFIEVTARLATLAEAWCRMAEESSADTPADTLAHALAPWLFGEGLLGDDAARERTLRGLAQSLPRVPAATLRRAKAGMLAWSGTRAEDLQRVTATTLVLVAGEDLLTPGAERLAASIPDARCVVVPGAGHALAIDGADAVTQALLAHLQRC
ncbi:MAG: alpha/beta fold hydrolase [Deltaproteobacteria bacterium]|nr:alpha/beta fold hydrolase [Deltaproteobacteria bacterium]